MKIICIGRNYAEHARELNNPVPSEPVFFLKPDTSLLVNNKPFYYPPFSNEIHYETEIVLRICRVGRFIAPQFAHRYYKEIGIGIDFTARDLQQKAKEKGLPWRWQKPLKDQHRKRLCSPLRIPDPKRIYFRLEINGKVVQQGNTADMLFGFDDLISYVSAFLLLKQVICCSPGHLPE
jgi:2-keto-4-pentenoate hydratase/2-oxohepta-3-ene-1,7-dioic acid hydratase in catechol pathway